MGLTDDFDYEAILVAQSPLLVCHQIYQDYALFPLTRNDLLCKDLGEVVLAARDLSETRRGLITSFDLYAPEHWLGRRMQAEIFAARLSKGYEKVKVFESLPNLECIRIFITPRTLHSIDFVKD